MKPLRKIALGAIFLLKNVLRTARMGDTVALIATSYGQ